MAIFAAMTTCKQQDGSCLWPLVVGVVLTIVVVSAPGHFGHLLLIEIFLFFYTGAKTADLMSSRQIL